MFEKNMRLILDDHIQIDVDQFKAMQKEYRQFLKQKLSEDSSTSFKEFAS